MNNWFSKAFKGVKNFNRKLAMVEHNVLDESRNFMEVFERNIYLEKEIEEKTEDLSQANKSILTLKHIWSTMNSSEPLSNVLMTITNGLCDEMGYLYSIIFQIEEIDGRKILKAKISSKNSYSSKINNIIQGDINNLAIDMENNKENIIVKAVNANETLNTKNLFEVFKGCHPEFSNEHIQGLTKLFAGRSVAVIPIPSQSEMFGCLIVISIRTELTPTEKNFLTLFARQTDLAVTIAGLFEQVRKQAITDPLTGVFNRRHFEQCLQAEADRARRLKQPFTLVMLDLDFLKKINDKLGHSAGDAAIVRIGEVLKQNARSVDIPARLGGEEFALILPGIDMEGGIIAAERIRSAIEETPVKNVGKVTASIGVSTFLKHAYTTDELVEMADAAMYRAKEKGRNQVKVSLMSESNKH
ncbi:MAG: diguanylate cyclase [Candidatus Gastranaerophilales bacterium]|nr:diguanylate cyclase [Candidatus Gastranaerophilales bacterium]